MIRRFFYRALDRLQRGLEDFHVERLKADLGACGQRVSLSSLCHISSVHLLRIGNDVEINAFTQIFAGGGVSIGDGTLISSNCAIASVTHVKNSTARHSAPLDAPGEKPLVRPVTIGRNVWIGAGAVILPGVTIGDHAIVGAGAVVTKDVPEKSVVVGNPARVLEKLALDSASERSERA